MSEKKEEMTVCFSQKTIAGEVPENIIADVRSTFTKFEVQSLEDGTVSVKVPKREKEIAKKLNEDIYSLLINIKRENSVLAGKLARRYGF
jgi:hypothetical protein